MTDIASADRSFEALAGKKQLGIPVTWVFWLLLAIFVINNWLLLAFLGQGISILTATIVGAGIGLALLSARQIKAETPKRFVTLPQLGFCFIIALTLLILGGEGRFLYANLDWQVRDAVLYDLVNNPWPFAYVLNGEDQILRAPLGMYLIPALLSKGVANNADLSLLASNTIVLTLLLAGASTLFKTRQHGFIALAVFLSFSGLDIVGTWIIGLYYNVPSPDHIELWAGDLQYSSNLTLLYWVPQHTFAGWMCALAIVLYLHRAISLGALAATIPLVALWSPLAIMGAAPFVAWLGLKALFKKQCSATDIVLGILAVIVAAPALKYLTADSAELQQSFVYPENVALFLLLEIGPWFILARALGRSAKFGADIYVLTLILCCIIPFWKIGTGIDFQMRASITPLAILALLVALSLCNPVGRIGSVWKFLIALLLLLSAQTGLAETLRAFRYQPPPPPLCNLPQMWTLQTGRVAEIETYIARANRLPEWLQSSMPINKVGSKDPPNCWSRKWNMKR